MKTVIGVSVLVLITIALNSQTVQWAKQYGAGGSDYGARVAIDKHGFIYTVGTFENSMVAGSATLISAGASDIFVLKSDPNTGNIIWAARYGDTVGDYGAGIVADTSGRLYVIGSFSQGGTSIGSYSLSSLGGMEIFVAELDAANGSVNWARSYGGSDYDQGFQILCDNQNGLYISGSYSATATFGTFTSTPNGKWDVFAAKLKAHNGDVKWFRQFGGPNDELGLSIMQDIKGAIYATSGFTGSLTVGNQTMVAAGGSQDIYITKLDSTNGQVTWNRQFGSNFTDGGGTMSCDAGGRIYSTGRFTDTVNFDGTKLYSSKSMQGYLMQLDPQSGQVLWAKNTGISGHISAHGNNEITMFSEFYDVVTIGNYSLSATGTWSVFSADFALVKVNASNGSLISIKQFGGEAMDHGGAFVSDAAGNLYVTGYFRGQTNYDAFTFTSVTGSGTPPDIFLLKIDGAPLPVGLTVEENELVHIFPNPCGDRLNLSSIGNDLWSKEVRITDVLGKTTLYKNENHDGCINVAELPAGVYLLIVQKRSGGTYSRKFIKD